MEAEQIKKELEEQIIKAILELRTHGLSYGGTIGYHAGWCDDVADRLANTLALINSQEQRIGELGEENERLRAENKTLTNDNAELKNEIQEAEFTEEEIDLLDEYTRLLNEGIRDAKANNLSEIKTRFALRYGTYTDKDMTPIIEVFRLLDQIAKEMLEGEK